MSCNRICLLNISSKLTSRHSNLSFVIMSDQLIDRDQISSAVEALKKYLAKISVHQKKLLNPAEQENIHLQFAVKKVSLKKKIVRIQLPHSLVDENTSVCLFVRDEERNSRDYSETVDGLREELNSAGINQRIEIVPLKQLKLEYKEYESKRSLLTLYDMFLADARIVRLLPPQLGKHFYVRKRHPVQVDLTKKQSLKKEIERALHTTQCVIAGRGSSGQVTVARMSQSADEVVDNVVAAIQRLSTTLVGSAMNIRSLHLKVQDAPSLPIYISIGSKAEVKFEQTSRKRPRAAVEDVTTVTDGKVIATNLGRVKVVGNGTQRKKSPKVAKTKPAAKDQPKVAVEEKPIAGAKLSKAKKEKSSKSIKKKKTEDEKKKVQKKSVVVAKVEAVKKPLKSVPLPEPPKKRRKV